MTDSPTTTTTSSPPPPPPLRIGVLLFPGFQALDVFGPLDVLNVLSWSTNSNTNTPPSTPSTSPPPTPPISLTLLSTTLSPYPHSPLPPQRPLPIHPPNSNPHLCPAARRWGTRAPLPQHIEYIRSVYPSLKYLLTVCTGGKLAARAGVLDGKRATTNKNDWESVVKDAPRVEWVREARWVVHKSAGGAKGDDGVEVWSSAGVSAGVDLMFAWVESIWGEEVAGRVERVLEFRRWREGERDPFVC
ncbi:class I glutamine amidotransferase-like protein [Aspergillus eucalypticola CBS 122712]|uniref:Class I glutamine amidotransferase-like protein n=1 Tax=Aspergillus eucalypticola (strain CBS 122712 / IBT 29274) TaxID=1448314 RepID=A0A317VZT3_ASPEC|nr:class I glutamine amidotransferase-like protein [Aspergillus eucalypticola CBS 122712]PWY79884.1 class I glutamine amidotransferase-like protein [Aspergillus eucalypticola CBS 122712]